MNAGSIGVPYETWLRVLPVATLRAVGSWQHAVWYDLAMTLSRSIRSVYRPEAGKK
jgi:hypothetical protein